VYLGKPCGKMLYIPRLAAVIFVVATAPADACIMEVDLDLNDITYADVVVVGRIENYEIVRDTAFRESKLAIPDLPEDLRKLYSDETQGLLGDYARFVVQVDEVLAGDVSERFSATWDNSTFGEPRTYSSESLIMAFRRPESPTPPLRGPSATILANPEPETLTVLQAPCAKPFIFVNSPETNAELKEILTTKP
jgi:hypothetical protein